MMFVYIYLTLDQPHYYYSFATTTMKMIHNVRAIVDDYDAFVIDMYGVLHNGTEPYPHVIETVRQLRQAGKHLTVLSNSARRRTEAVAQLKRFGFVKNEDEDKEDDMSENLLFDAVVTSGEVAAQKILPELLQQLPKQSSSSSSSLFSPSTTATTTTTQRPSVLVLGSGSSADDATYVEDCGGAYTTQPQEASLILARGPYSVVEPHTQQCLDLRYDPHAYTTMRDNILRASAARKVPMLVTNPDKVSPTLPYLMPGKIGDMYQDMLEEANSSSSSSSLVQRCGKPFGAVYDYCLGTQDMTKNNNNHNQRQRRVCMVGDALETDILGGNWAGIDTLWIVGDGIHRRDLDDKALFTLDAVQRIVDQFHAKAVGTYAEGQTVRPTHVMEHFVW